MATTNDVVEQMRATLAATDPDLDTSVGTTGRKILDAVGEAVAEASLDGHMSYYTYDIDSKSEGDLDSFCQTVGGISRLAGRRASGTVTFRRAGALTTTIFISVNTEILCNSNPSITFQTLSGASMLPGETTVTVSVHAVNAGPQANVPAASLTIQSSFIDGVTSVTNPQATTGGMFQETDAELRLRWKRTALRSNAGTESMHLALALDDPDVTSAVVLGSSIRRREQIQIASGVATSTNLGVAYTYLPTVIVGADIDNGVLLIRDLDYTVTFVQEVAQNWILATATPKITISPGSTTYDTGRVDALGIPIRASMEGAVLELEYEYVPSDSRNDPDGTRFGAGPVGNRIDVWVAGQRPVAATQSIVFKTMLSFSSVATSPYYVNNWLRLRDTNRLVAGNIFIPLSFGPIISVPDTLSIATKTYGRIGGPTGVGVDFPNSYDAVYEDAPFGQTPNSRFGLEFLVANLPPVNSVFTIGATGGYLYNDIGRSVQQQISRWRLAGTDAAVHCCRRYRFRVNLVIMYSPGVNQTSVNASINTALATFLEAAPLGQYIQISDVEQLVHGVYGVDAVRMADASDFPGWTWATSSTFPIGIQHIENGTVLYSFVSSTGRPKDIPNYYQTQDVLDTTTFIVKAQNTFRA